jgi:hypothetical protein
MLLGTIKKLNNNSNNRFKIKNKNNKIFKT